MRICPITSLQLFLKIKIQTHVLYCIIKAVNNNYTKRDEFVSTAYYTLKILFLTDCFYIFRIIFPLPPNQPPETCSCW